MHQGLNYGQIAGNKAINKAIYLCFSYLPDSEVLKFVQKFKEQPHDKIQVMHTFHELILGAYLSKNGFTVYNEFKIESQTPDWCILDEKTQPICILELVNFHLDAKTSSNIVHQMNNKGLFYNWVKPNTKRLYNSIWEKSSKYKSISNKYNLPYVISVFGDFVANVNQDEIDECLFDEDTGIFVVYPEVSGLIFFEESSGDYLFMYIPNTRSRREIKIPGGSFLLC